jgi:hypothetical protein
LAGVGPAYLQARWPDDVAVLRAIAIRADLEERDRRKDLAILIGNRIAEAMSRG